MRPKQWIKNTFVFAGLVFAGRATNPKAIYLAAVAFAAFCLASGAAYLLNDARDAVGDRTNPRTASRPVARGDLSANGALAAAVVSATAALLIAGLVINLPTLATLAGFVAIQLSYSYGVKHILCPGSGSPDTLVNWLIMPRAPG